MKFKSFINIFLLVAISVFAEANKLNELGTVTTYKQESILVELNEKKEISDLDLVLGSENKEDAYPQQTIDFEIDRSVLFLKGSRQRLQSELKFIEYSFLYIKSKYLRHYDADADFSDVFENKKYNCVTGSLLFAMIFNRLGIDYQIVETCSHVCLHLQYDTINVLLEPTMRDGIVKNRKDIFFTMCKYQKDKNEKVVKVLKCSYTPTNSGYYIRRINFEQLVGLQYYNKAAQYLETKQYKLLALNAAVAQLLYPSSRTQGFVVYSIGLLLNDRQLDYKSKSRYYLWLKDLINESLLVLK